MKVKHVEGDRLTFTCPGCKDTHTFRVGNGGWSFNGDVDRPTVSPSLLVTTGHYCERANADGCWCTYNAENPENPAPFKCYRCHSFIRDGRIEFCGDSTHDLAGQTVALPEIESAADRVDRALREAIASKPSVATTEFRPFPLM